MSSIDLTHHFLIAMPNMADPYFAKSLTYICEHNDQGALGLVVNRPIDLTLQALFERLQLSLRGNEHAGAPVYFDDFASLIVGTSNTPPTTAPPGTVPPTQSTAPPA